MIDPCGVALDRAMFKPKIRKRNLISPRMETGPHCVCEPVRVVPSRDCFLPRPAAVA